MAALALGPILHAQVAPSTPAFEVASVKSYGGALIGRAIRHVPAEGQVLLTNHSLLALINYAFDVKNRYGLEGTPEWIAIGPRLRRVLRHGCLDRLAGHAARRRRQCSVWFRLRSLAVDTGHVAGRAWRHHPEPLHYARA
jgi:hypothetical protein